MKLRQAFSLLPAALLFAGLIAACNILPETGVQDADLLSARAATTTTVQAESQTWTTSSGDSVSASSTTLRLQGNAVGDNFSFTTGSVPAGTYTVSVYAAKRNIYGIHTVAINGTQLGSAIDFYSSAGSDTWSSFSLGTVTLASSSNTVKFTISGKNSSASDYDAKIDYILFTASSGTTSPTATPTATAVPTATPTATAAPTATPTSTATAAPTATPTATPAPTSTGSSSALYVSPSGVAGASGTISAPTTLADAITRVASGGTIYVRGGTYNLSVGIAVAIGNNGTSSAKKNLVAYSGETPVLNFSAMATSDSNRGLTLNGNYWYVKGLIIERAGDNGIYIGGSNNTVELCTTRYNKDTGLQLGRASTSYTSISQWPSNNLILNCTSHDNADPSAENADGFASKLTTGTGNVFRGCIAHHNIDDGWDLYAKDETGPIGPVTIEGCIAYANGTLSDGSSSGSGDKNGFKLGGSGIDVAHTIKRSIAFNNGKHGFTDNNNQGAMVVMNNTSFGNAESNFNWRTGSTSTFTNNVSLNTGASDKFNGTLTGTTNIFWVSGKVNNNGGSLTVSTSDFQSLSVSSFSRNSDGSIAYGNFAKLTSSSPLVNAGSPSGTDIGAIESY